MMRNLPLAGFSFLLIFLFMTIFGSEVLTRLRLKGRIPVVTSMSINGRERKNGSLFTTRTLIAITAADIASGSVSSEDSLRIGEIQANLPVFLEIRIVDWQLNNPLIDSIGFLAPEPQTKTVEVRVAGLDHESGTLAAVQTGFHRLDNNAEKILQMGRVSQEGYYSGLRGGQAELDLRIPLELGKDLPGLYRLDLELIISPQFQP